MSKEELEEMKEQFLSDLDNGLDCAVWYEKEFRQLIEQAENNFAHLKTSTNWMNEALRLERQNKRYRKAIESMTSEIKYVLYSNKSKDVKEHYLKNAERFGTEALEGESNE